MALSLINKMATLGSKKSASVAVGFVFYGLNEAFACCSFVRLFKETWRLLFLIEISVIEDHGVCTVLLCAVESGYKAVTLKHKNVNTQKRNISLCEAW